MVMIVNIGKNEVLNPFPAIEKWAVKRDITIPNTGDNYDERTGEVYDFDLHNVMKTLTVEG